MGIKWTERCISGEKSKVQISGFESAWLSVIKNTNNSQVLVAQACNSSSSRGRDQEDHGSNPAQASSPGDPVLKKPITKKGWWSGSGCKP
jgi:hypothetical protein